MQTVTQVAHSKSGMIASRIRTHPMLAVRRICRLHTKHISHEQDVLLLSLAGFEAEGCLLLCCRPRVLAAIQSLSLQSSMSINSLSAAFSLHRTVL